MEAVPKADSDAELQKVKGLWKQVMDKRLSSPRRT